MAPRTHSVAVSLPHRALPLADWADCYELQVPGNALTARSAAERSLGDFPAWVRILMRLRNAIVRPFGLKGSAYQPANRQDMIGVFPILAQSDDQIVLGFDDTHLDFRIVVDVCQGAGADQLVSVTTLVHRKILLGKIYIAVVTPFHRLIVRTMLGRLSRPAMQAT